VRPRANPPFCVGAVEAPVGGAEAEDLSGGAVLLDEGVVRVVEVERVVRRERHPEPGPGRPRGRCAGGVCAWLVDARQPSIIKTVVREAMENGNGGVVVGER